MYGVQNDIMFGIRSLLRKTPIRFLIVILIFGVFMFGIMIRYCEAPLTRVSNNPFFNLRSMENAFWLAITTMTTVGYGDYFPRTLYGRIITFFCAIYGVVVISIMVVAIQNTLKMDPLEERAYTCIIKLDLRKVLVKEASQLIGKFMIFAKKCKQTSLQSAKRQGEAIKLLSHQFMKGLRFSRLT